MTAVNGAAPATASTVSEGQIGGELEEPTSTKLRLDHTTVIRAVAELFPDTFVIERYRPHRPLKRGIGNDLIERGVLTRQETRFLHSYTNRRQYLVASVEGAERIGLDGQPCGTVTADEAQWAAIRLAHLDARQAALAAAQRTAREEHKREREAAHAKDAARFVANRRADRAAADKTNGAGPHREVQPEIIAVAPPLPVTAASPQPPRLSLAGLKAAAQARRAAAEAGRQQP